MKYEILRYLVRFVIALPIIAQGIALVLLLFWLLEIESAWLSVVFFFSVPGWVILLVYYENIIDDFYNQFWDN